MKRLRLPIPWPEGLHLRPAAELVKLVQRFRSSVRLRLDERMADARSIIAILLLGASGGTLLDFEITGIDEEEASEAIATLFEADAGPSTDDRRPGNPS